MSRLFSSAARPKQISVVLRTMQLIWVATRGWSVIWSILLVGLGIIPIATVVWMKDLVNSLVEGVRAGGTWPAMRPTVVYGCLIAGATLLMELLGSILEGVRTAQAELIQDYISARVHEKSLEVDMAFYESPGYYDSLYRARDEASTRPALFLEHLGSVIQNTVTVALLTALIATYTPWMVLLMVLGAIPAFFVVAQHNWRIHQWWKQTTAERRWIQYYDQKFTLPASAAEMRLFRLGPYFRAAYEGLRGTLRSQRLRMVWQLGVSRVAAGLASLLVVGASITWIGWRVFHGLATLGDLTLFYQAIVGGQGLTRVITSSLSQVYGNSLFFGDFFSFLDLRPKILTPQTPAPFPREIKHGIDFQKVSFSYPGSERSALVGFDLTVPAGQIVAIVGPNGAGKSTLMKLLCRFYDPSGGAILVDGIDLREFSVEELRDNLSVLFQSPVGYDASVSDNIAMGDLRSATDQAAIEAAAFNAGVHETVLTLPRGYGTQLGKSFENGTDLSGGEWQKIAMARAFLRRAPVILLDEPTSFMDSWAEVEWFDRLRNLAKGRTTLMITHRFTIAMRADWIQVMKDGRIIESGTHDILLRRAGFYAESWRNQMEASQAAA